MIDRRDALKLLGAGIASAALPGSGAAAEFPKGATIRTVLKDLPPEALSGGATLFHEHLSLGPDFMPRWMSLFLAGRTSRNPPAQPVQPAQPYFMQDPDLID